ncbi:MAG TPA: formylglycine-generating enzyme family protein [Phycisphaerales bacterium]|nr:formylglycine-generating enzyme family protein [Phycisphaerales bacterium]
MTTRATWYGRRRSQRKVLVGVLPALCVVQGCTCSDHPAPTSEAQVIASSAQPFEVKIPASGSMLNMVPILVHTAEGTKHLWISQTEIPWEAFDPFVYHLDSEAMPDGSADAVSRPSKPYLPPDRGFGHEGFPALSMSFKNAQAYCDWLSQRTGRHFRLPTVEEWQIACKAGSTTKYCFGDSETELGDYAWFHENADGAPHAVAKKKPNAWGLFDMHGNVAEWCVGADGKGTTCGGSYRDSADKLTCDSQTPQSSSWNASDPQMPKSQWWLSDGPFVGFRIVCDRAE